MSLNNRIPPPIVMITFGALVFFTRAWLPAPPIPLGNLIAVLFFIAGGLVIFFGIREFGTKETTVNPLKPEEATSLVTSGIFGVTRNPMYLGLTLILIAFSIRFGGLTALAWVPLFVIYITRFQILPEEAAMRSLFGEQFEAYCQSVRRWI